MRKPRINDKIKLAIARYYSNRDSQYIERRVEGTSMKLVEPCSDSSRKKWDKDADHRAITAEAAKLGLHYSACAGTFWFQKGGWIIECNESTFLDGGILKKPAKV
jgi:hypothetical protein